MKIILKFTLLLVILSACGMKVPYTNMVRDEFGLDTDVKLRKVQFYTSHTIIMDQIIKADNQVTTQNGTLISSSNSEKETIIIPAGTKCIFEDFGQNGEMFVRFETGEGKVIKFTAKSDGVKRYYFDADWSASGGAKIKYGSEMYKIDLLRGEPRSAHLTVARKKLQKIKRKDRVIRGLKV